MGWMTKRLEGRIRSEGLLQPDDQLVAVEVGDVVMWRSNGQLRSAGRPYMAVGYGSRGLAIVGQEWVAGVDLLMVRRVELLDADTARPIIKISFIDDRDGSMTEFMWKPQNRRRARQLADAILGSAARRQQSLPPAATNMIVAWERELERREQEAERLRKEPGDRQLTHVAGLGINVETLAFSRDDVPTEPAFATRGALLLLADGRIAMFAGADLIARFKLSDLDYLSFPGPLGVADGSTGPWELGYKTQVGSRRLLFTGPGLALSSGHVDEAADHFLRESGLMTVKVEGRGPSWRP